MRKIKKAIVMVMVIYLGLTATVFGNDDVYINEDLNFKIQFPDNFTLDSLEIEQGKGVIASYDESITTFIALLVVEDVEGDFRSASDQYMEDFVEGMKSELQNQTIEETSINGLMFYMSEIENKENSMKIYHYSGQYNDKLYAITVSIMNDEDELLKQMIESINSFELVNDTYQEEQKNDSNQDNTAFKSGYFAGQIVFWILLIIICYKLIKSRKRKKTDLMKNI